VKSTDVRDFMNTLLGEMGIPFGYGDLTDPVSPFISWYISDSVFTVPEGGGFPDGVSLGAAVREDTITVELYTTGKDWELEDRLEALIERYGPRKHEEKNYYEAVYQISYTFTITTKQRRT